MGVVFIMTLWGLFMMYMGVVSYMNQRVCNWLIAWAHAAHSVAKHYIDASRHNLAKLDTASIQVIDTIQEAVDAAMPSQIQLVWNPSYWFRYDMIEKYLDISKIENKEVVELLFKYLKEGVK